MRPWRLTDVDDAYAYGSDPEWGWYLWNVPQPYTREDAEAFVRSAVDDTSEDRLQLAIELDGRVIGGVRLYIIDKSARVAGIGYNIGVAFWNRGYATEAASAALDHAFSAVGLRRVRAEADARNHSSIRVRSWV